MRPTWRIYYSDREVTGGDLGDWLAAPDEDVQVVVLYEPTEYRGWKGVPDGNRQLWTGDDEFDPFGYGHPKQGRLLDDAEYFAIWERAIADPHPQS